jgi:hypothetical protein
MAEPDRGRWDGVVAAGVVVLVIGAGSPCSRQRGAPLGEDRDGRVTDVQRDRAW